MVILFEFNILLKSVYLYILFTLVAATLNKFVKNQKVIILSLLGGVILSVISLIEIISSMEMMIVTLVIILLGIVLFKPKKFHKLLIIILVYAAYTLLKWGFSYALQLIVFALYKISLKSLILYYIFDLALTSFISCIIYISFRVIYQKKLILDFVYDAKIVISGEEFLFKMLLDSGNSLIDDKTGLPVVVLSKSAIEEKILKKIDLDKLRPLGYQTLGGYCSNLFIFEPKKIVIYKNGCEKEVKAVAGIVEKKFKLYDGLLHTQTI